MSEPTPDQIRAAREAAGLTQTEAAGLVRAKLRAWQRWEAGERQMRASDWELFQLKTGQHPDSKLTARHGQERET